MLNKRKGEIAMTNVLTNVENIIDNYEDKEQQKINSRLESFLIVYRLRKLIKSDFAQEIIEKNIIRDKKINNGRCTVKGTRITPDDIGRLVTNEEDISTEEIFREFPSIENEEQILAGLFIFLKNNITWRKVLFTK